MHTPLIRITVHVYVLSCVQVFMTLWTSVCQVPLSMGFFRQEHWSGSPRFPPGDLPDPQSLPTQD